MHVLARPAFRNRHQNPYNALLYEALRGQGVKVSEYRKGSWWFGQYDIFHVHWPESAFNHGLISGAATHAELISAMDQLRRRGVRCVWTAHNLAAHERRNPGPEARAFAAFISRLDGFIALSKRGLFAARERYAALRALPGFVIPHPSYRGAYPDTLSRAEARARLALPQHAAVIAFVGRIMAYKNVPELARVFSELDAFQGRELRLLIAGRPHDRKLAELLGDVCARDSRVRMSFQHVPDAELQTYLRAADLVALPYREIFNSGSALLALSFDRPVLMPETAAALDLRDSYGPAWVHSYATLTPQVIHGALDAARTLPERPPSHACAARAPVTIAAQTRAAYVALLSAAVRSERRV